MRSRAKALWFFGTPLLLTSTLLAVLLWWPTNSDQPQIPFESLNGHEFTKQFSEASHTPHGWYDYIEVSFVIDTNKDLFSVVKDEANQDGGWTMEEDMSDDFWDGLRTLRLMQTREDYDYSSISLVELGDNRYGCTFIDHRPPPLLDRMRSWLYDRGLHFL